MPEAVLTDIEERLLLAVANTDANCGQDSERRMSHPALPAFAQTYPPTAITSHRIRARATAIQYSATASEYISLGYCEV